MSTITSRIQSRMNFFSRRVFDKFSTVSSYDLTPKVWYFFVIAFFFLLVLLPTTYVIVFLIERASGTFSLLTAHPEYISMIQEAVFNSVIVSVSVAVIDLIFGIPLAWLVVRGKFRYKNLLNTLIELPLAVPTAGLGLSVAMFWGVTVVENAPIFSLGFVTGVLPILILFHFTTTFPYVVRSLAAILEEIDITLEIAAQTCGASKFTAARTITLPLFRSGVATALVLSIAKSLSDTGGIVAVLTAIGSLALTGTRLIDNWKKTEEDPIIVGNREPLLAFVSVIMIIIAILLMSASRIIARRIRFPTRKVWPNWERSLSKKNAVNFRDSIAIGFLILFILVPSFFIFVYIFTGFTGLDAINWTELASSIFNSLIVATLATAINLIIGVPLAVFITRKDSPISRILDVLVDIPYVVPSAALGFSVGLFWSTQVFIYNEFFFVVMAHMSMTFPFIVRNTVGGLSDLSTDTEDTARTLGAKPFAVFSLISFPVIKFSIIAGIIMSFTRSIGETGATTAVSTKVNTAPAFIKRLIQSGDFFGASLAIITLIAVTSAIIFLLRKTLGFKRKNR